MTSPLIDQSPMLLHHFDLHSFLCHHVALTAFFTSWITIVVSSVYLNYDHILIKAAGPGDHDSQQKSRTTSQLNNLVLALPRSQNHGSITETEGLPSPISQEPPPAIKKSSSALRCAQTSWPFGPNQKFRQSASGIRFPSALPFRRHICKWMYYQFQCKRFWQDHGACIDGKQEFLGNELRDCEAFDSREAKPQGEGWYLE